jgi:hypothetical protein
MHIECHDLRERFWDFPLGNPHKKSLKDLFNAVQRDLRRRKVLIVYEGIEETVALMSTVLPTWDKVLACQPSIVSSTLVNRAWKASFFDFPVKSGSHGYLVVAAIALKGRMLLTLLIGEVLVFLLNSIKDLAILTACLDH